MADVVTLTGDANEDNAAIERAADILRKGGIVAIPTETVYGLAGNALNPDAVQKIYDAKGRPATNPLIVHVLDTDQARELASTFPPVAEQLAAAFWPGPLTIIVPKTADVPDSVTAGFPSVAIRVPSHPVMRAVIEAAGVPLAAPSANRSQAVSPTRAGHVLKSLGDRIDLILDAGTTEHGLESTVVDCTSLPPRVMRPGPITLSQLEAVVGKLRLEEGVIEDSAARLSPGMSQKHYAPKATVKVVSAERLAKEIADAEAPAAVFLLGGAVLNANATLVQMPANAVAYGAILYSELHKMDDSGMKTIIVEDVPRDDGWEAVRDRLRRASA